MRVALVAMPWAAASVPSVALGALSAFVRRGAPQLTVDCKHAYTALSRKMSALYPLFADHGPAAGELVYAGHLYPERRERVIETLGTWLSQQDFRARGLDAATFEPFASRVRDTIGLVEQHLEATARELAEGDYRVVGLTTSMAQLFSSLALARRLRELRPETLVVLGGAGVEAGAESILQEYPFVDYVIAGEGERRLLELLQQIREGIVAPPPPGVLGRAPRASREAPPAAGKEVVLRFEDLDSLPAPDYDEFLTKETEGSEPAIWEIPIEGSRGCWWYRAPSTGNPMHGCHFCALNGTSRYREKGARQIAREMREQADRYGNVRFRFTDNVFRHKGLVDLAREIKKQRRDFRFFAELRANVRPIELLELREAGCWAVQLGIEGLSTRYLRRMNKGTSTIQNLQAMRLCAELGLSVGTRGIGNLLVRFPGATEDEVRETAENIRSYALAYSPLSTSEFSLDVTSAVGQMPGQFGVTNIRNTDGLAAGFPSEVFGRLELPWKSFDAVQGGVSWAPVAEAVEEWRALHAKLMADGSAPDAARPLYYLDGAIFLEVIDRRAGFRRITLPSPWREIYLFLMEIRSLGELVSAFDDWSEQDIREKILARLLRERLLFEEGGKYLALAIALHPESAARRIRAAERDRRRAARSSPTSP